MNGTGKAFVRVVDVLKDTNPRYKDFNFEEVPQEIIEKALQVLEGLEKFENLHSIKILSDSEQGVLVIGLCDDWELIIGTDDRYDRDYSNAKIAKRGLVYMELQ